MNRLLAPFLLILALRPNLRAQGPELLKSWQPVKALEGGEPIRKMAVSADGSLVLIHTRDNRLRIVDAVKKETLRVVRNLPPNPVALAGAGLKHPVLVATERALYSLDPTGEGAPKLLWETRDAIYAISCAPTREFCAVATSEGAYVVNTRTGDLALSTREATCFTAQFAPNEKTLALALGKRVVIYEVPTFVQKQAWAINGNTFSLAYAPNSEFIALGGDGNTLTLNRLADGNRMKSLSLGVSAKEVDHLAFAGDQSGLFVGVGQRLIVFNDLNQDKPAAKAIKLEEKIHSLGFSRASESLLIGTEGERALAMWGVTLPKAPDPIINFEVVRPPTLTMLSPAGEALAKDTLQDITFKVQSNGPQEVVGIRVLVDGRPARVLAAQAPLGAKPESVNGVVKQRFVNGQEYRFKVEVPSQDATLVVLAESAFATSSPAVTRLRWEASAPPPAPAPIQVIPPSITLISPTQEASLVASRLVVEARLHAPSTQPITQVRILVDGAPVQATPEVLGASVGATPAPLLSGQAYRFALDVPPRDCTVVLIAETAYANSNPAVVKVRWKGEGGQAPTRPDIPIVPPSLRILEPRSDSPFKAGLMPVALTLTSAPDQEATTLKFFLDGVPVQATADPDSLPDPKGRLPHGRAIRYQVDLPKRDCVLMVLAANAFGTGNPVVLPLKWEGTAAQPTPPTQWLPPTVRILDPRPESRFKGPQVALKVQVEVQPGQKATGLRAFVDGVPVTPLGAPLGQGPGLPTGTPLEVVLPVPERDCTVLLLADNEKVTGNPAVLRLLHDAPPPPPAPPVQKLPEKVVPPSVKILAAAPEILFKASEYLLSLQVGSVLEQEIRQLRVFLDGAPLTLSPVGLAEGKDPYANGATLQFKVPVPDRDCTLMVLAESAFRQSEPAVLRLKYDRPVPPPVKVKVVKPIVTILDPAPNALVKATTVQMRVKVVTAADHPISTLRVLVDGRPAESLQLRGLRPQQDAPAPAPQDADALLKQEVRSLSFTIPTKDCSVMVYADTDLASSDPDVLNLRFERKELQSLPTLYLLAVGVSQYRDASYALKFPSKDARDFAALMERQKGQHYKEIKTRVLVDGEATRDNVADAFDWLARQVTQKDVAIVFLAGHGINNPVNNKFYYMPHNADIEAPGRTMVSGNDIHDTLSRMLGKRILFMDTCHSGNVGGQGQRAVADMDRFLLDLTQAGQGLVVFAASKGSGVAEEDAKWGNGAFTKALLEGLTGRAGRDANGLVTWKMLDSHITQRVKELTSGKQQPTTTPTPDTADFSLVVLETP